MIQSTTTPPVFQTVADLLDHLGDIPASRVRLHPTPGTATERDLLTIRKREKRLYELVDGVLVEKAMGFYESRLAAVLIQILGNYLDQHDQGIVTGPDGMMKLAPGLIRIPDVAFVSWEQLPDRKLPREPVPDLAPDLAVEVLSAGNSQREMARKCEEYFAAGTQLVWLLNAEKRTMQVFTAVDQSNVVREDQMLDGGSVLPGFSLPLGELFDRAGRQSEK